MADESPHAFEPAETSEPARTYGERAVGLDFNPSGNPAVSYCKEKIAAAIDQMHDLRNASPDPEIKRLASLAITEMQGAAMWGVKALTWKS